MADNKMLGVVFSNMHDEAINELTAHRTTASVPFGGRYRLIDFTLSNLINSGIDMVGVITKSNYQSLMDHVGSGKEWDLARKIGGLKILPPYSNTNNGMYRGNVDALNGILEYIMHSRKQYTLLTDCDVIGNIDYKKALKAHIASGAALTLICKDGKTMLDNHLVTVDIDDDGYLKGIGPVKGGENVFLNMGIANTDVLVREVQYSVSQNKYDFITDLIPSLLKNHKIYCYNTEVTVLAIENMQSFFSANMELLDGATRKEIFNNERPIYTKVRDEVPVKYGLNAKACNSMIADGCIIDGEVENSVIFRGVTVGKGSKISNCILMQGTVIADNCQMEHVVTDKDVLVRSGRKLSGDKNYPFFISKGTHI